jgi:hypothetical protein
MTYLLEVDKKSAVSDRACDYKTRARQRTDWGWQEKATSQFGDVITNEGKDYNVHPEDRKGGQRVRSQVRLQKRARTTYTLKVEREGDMSDCSCNYKTRTGTTYRLEVERESDMSDRS